MPGTRSDGARPGPRRHVLRQRLWRLVVYLVLFAFLAIFLVPFVWIWFAALKTSQPLGMDPLGVPTELHWENLSNAWTSGHSRRSPGNSAIYSTALGSGVVLFPCLAAPAFACLKLPWRNGLFVLFLL